MNIHFECQRFKPLNSHHLSLSEVESDLVATNLYLERAGKPIAPVVGEFHFSRCPQECWEDEIRKMKAGGVTVISTYLFWILHEEREGEFSFAGDRDIRKFLSLCEKNEMLVLLRIGPWCHGEVVYGGFPEFIQERQDKRTSSPEYLEKVRNLYRAYYEQVKDFFYQNGSVVIGIQLENEYGGKDRDYIPSLRKMAVEVGFRLPLYTITAWPPNGSLKGDLLPMFGRYPERPWVQNTQALPVHNRFCISSEKIDKGIDVDILKDVVWEELPYDDFPYATCELGCGVQVYEHRRPIISDRDAYFIGLMHLAQGVNVLGYYMYHGGRNPQGRYQESRSTGYPNNCPISSYDFQAPISEYGFLRRSYHRLRLLHLFLADYAEEFAAAQPFFCEKTGGQIDRKVSVRIHPEGGGYLFVNNHQRLVPYDPIENAEITVHTAQGSCGIPRLDVPSGVSAMFPMKREYGLIRVEYLLAQPICYEKADGVTRYYFFVPDGIACRGKLAAGEGAHLTGQNADGETLLVANEGQTPAFTACKGNEKTELYLLTQQQAESLWKMNGRVFFCHDTVLACDGQNYTVDRATASGNCMGIRLEEMPAHHPMEGDDYLFSAQPAKEYVLHVPRDIFSACEDCRVAFRLVGNVAQLYCGDTLMADWFNYDQHWEIGLKRFRKQIEQGQKITLVVSALDKDHPVYLECPIPRDRIELQLEGAASIQRQTFPCDESCM